MTTPESTRNMGLRGRLTHKASLAKYNVKLDVPEPLKGIPTAKK